MRGMLMIALAAVAMTMGVSAAEAQTKMTKNFWIYSGTKYRRGGAESAILGSAGVVRKTFGKAYDYERKEAMTRKLMKRDRRLRIRRPAGVKGLSTNQFSKDSAFKYLTLGVSDTLSQLRRGELELVKLEVSSIGELVDAMNGSPEYLDRLRRISPRANLRVVTAVWVVVQAKELADFSASANGKFSMMGYKVEGEHEGSSESSWDIKPGTIFAYEMAKVDWSKGRKRIEGLKVDRVNM